MSEIFIDIGPPKTATTFRQRVLFPAMDVCDFPACFKGDLQYIDFSRKDKVILSDESLYGWVYLPSHDAVRERRNALSNIKRWFPEAGIIICRRDIKSWKHSLYKQYVWAGGSDSFEVWLKHLDDNIWDIDGYIDRLQETFNQVLVLSFELLKQNHREFSRRICDFVGVPLPDYQNRQVNVSLSDWQMALLRQLNKLWWTHERKGIPGFRLWRGMLYMLSRKDKTE